MILSPILRMQFRPKLCYWFNQSRTVRPSIKIGKEIFQLQLDVKNYCKDEIRVKVAPDYVVIEGKQKKQTKRGLIVRRFVRKFKLPPGCINKCMESKLSPEGLLTITAPRRACGPYTSCEMLIPIKADFATDGDASFLPIETTAPKQVKVEGFCDQFKQDTTKKQPLPSEKQSGIVNDKPSDKPNVMANDKPGEKSSEKK